MTEETRVLLQLLHCKYLSRKRIRRLFGLQKTSSFRVTDFWQNPKEYKSLSISEKIVESIISTKKEYDLQKSLAEIEGGDFRVITASENQYPQLLAHTADPPLVLFVKGSIDLLNTEFPVAVVGTRQITQYGTQVTQLITEQLVTHSATIISGFMYGVDITAHKQAIQCGGATVAILGFGFNHMSPSHHQELLTQMLKTGRMCCVTEYLPHIPANKTTFPQRNRIVAGMSKGVVVTEAAHKSGSLITARIAGEEGREVFAVPGSIFSEFSLGTKSLVNQGATLVCGVEDILQEFGVEKLTVTQTDQQLPLITFSSAEQETVYQALQSPLSTNQLCKKLNVSLIQLQTVLSELEVEDKVQKVGGVWQQK